MNLRAIKKVSTFLSAAIVLSACTIDYGTSRTDTSSAPDFLFYDTTLTRVQNASPRAIMQADIIEQYGGEQHLYGKNLTFRLLTDRGDTTTVGSCNLFSMDQKNQQYTFLDSVEITSFEQDVMIHAGNLQWDNSTERMVSDKSTLVTIITGATGTDQSTVTTIQGTGLQVDGISHTFSFDGTISGTVVTEDSVMNVEAGE